MNKKIIYAGFIVIGIIVLITSSLFQINGQQKIEKETLKEEISDLNSLTSETLQLLSQYKNDKSTFTYLQIESQHINLKTQNFSSSLIKARIPDKYLSDTRKIENLNSEFSLAITQINNTNGDHKKLSKINDDILKTKKDIQKLKTKYE